MITLHRGKHYILENQRIAPAEESAAGAEAAKEAEGKRQTLTWQVLERHNHSGDMEHLQIRFDSMGVYDNTYVGILQTAYASGLKEFPMPCVFTNCHNCLGAVGGTINTDVHKYAESACKKSGGIFVPPHEAVIHQYMREMIINSGDMSIVSDSHTRYGTQGSLSIGEGGPELAKAMLGKYYEIDYPEVIAVFLTGAPKPWVGPMDVALSIIGKVFKNNFVKNKVLEFVGPGVKSLSMDFRNGIDTMTTESACLSSIWAMYVTASVQEQENNSSTIKSNRTMSNEIFVAFATQKGGIGKSTVTALAASYLHNVQGHNVAVIDCDAQIGRAHV